MMMNDIDHFGKKPRLTFLYLHAWYDHEHKECKKKRYRGAHQSCLHCTFHQHSTQAELGPYSLFNPG